MLHAAAVCSALAMVVPGVAPSTVDVRQAVERALPLLAKAADGHAAKRTCFGCHNQAFPMLAAATARGRGFAVGDEWVGEQVEFIHDFLDRNRDAFTAGKGTGGQVDTAGYALFTLEYAGYQPDDATAAVVEYLLKKDAARGPWHAESSRPPSEASGFTTNYLAARGLKVWAAAKDAERVARRTTAAREWALKTPAKDTEDHVFRLRLLKLTGADDAAVRAATADLLATQRGDGGWGQIDRLASDAYATGTALVALREDGGLSSDATAYRRGVAFLVRAQKADGSWRVKSRSKPFQEYFETGFPHGKDQFISAAASGWAATALALALPAKEPAGR